MNLIANVGGAADRSTRFGQRPCSQAELLGAAHKIKFAILALLVLFALAVVSGLLVAWDRGLSAAALEQLIRSWGMWGALASIGLMVAHTFVPFPAEFLAIANGMIYGALWGTVVTWIGAMLGAALAFALARALGRPFVRGMVARRNWHHMDEWSGRQGAYAILTLRLIPVIAFNLINYAAGLTRMSWWTFLWTTAIGILPLTVVMVAMGDALDRVSWQAWAALLPGAAAIWYGVLRWQRRAATGRAAGSGAQ